MSPPKQISFFDAFEQKLPSVKCKQLGRDQGSTKISNPSLPKCAIPLALKQLIDEGKNVLQQHGDQIKSSKVTWDLTEHHLLREADVIFASTTAFLPPVHAALHAYLYPLIVPDSTQRRNTRSQPTASTFYHACETTKTDQYTNVTGRSDLCYYRNDGNPFLILEYNIDGILCDRNLVDGIWMNGNNMPYNTAFTGKFADLTGQGAKYMLAYGIKFYAVFDWHRLIFFHFIDLKPATTNGMQHCVIGDRVEIALFEESKDFQYSLLTFAKRAYHASLLEKDEITAVLSSASLEENR